MTEDASLDDFLDAGSGAADDASEDDAPEADASEEDESVADANAEAVSEADESAEGASDADDEASTDAEDGTASDLDPAASVSSVSPEGAACESCGATVVRRWTDGEAAVCAECKEW